MNFHDQRAGAQRTRCPDRPHGCGAPVGDPCLNLQTDTPLEHRPAHEQRLRNAAALGLIDLDLDELEPTP